VGVGTYQRAGGASIRAGGEFLASTLYA